MMLLYAFNEREASDAIVSAVDKVLNQGLRTADLARGKDALTTVQMTDAIIENL
jgi:3-isopropylmalate dehydrogenase